MKIGINLRYNNLQIILSLCLNIIQLKLTFKQKFDIMINLFYSGTDFKCWWCSWSFQEIKITKQLDDNIYLNDIKILCFKNIKIWVNFNQLK